MSYQLGPITISGSVVSITGSLNTTQNVESTASWANNAVTASYALFAANGGGGSSFPFTGSAIITGSLVVTGSTISTLGITGSLQGTSSWATNALTASLAPNYVLTSATSSMLQPYVLTSATSSMLQPYVLTSTTASMLSPYALSSTLNSYLLISATSSMLSPYALSSTLNSYLLISATSSMLSPYLLSSQTSSFAITGSNNFNGNQVITGSLTVITGSSIELQVTNTGVRLGNAIADTHTVTGSMNVSGSIATAGTVNGATATEMGYLSGTTSAIQTQLNNKTYTLFFFSNAWTIAAGTTYYIANFPRAPQTTAGLSRVYIPKAGTITDAIFSMYSAGVAGSNNAITASIRLNNLTDYLIEQNATANVNRNFTNNSLSIPVVVGDYIEIKLQVATPYTTVPTNTFPTANVLIRS